MIIQRYDMKRAFLNKNIAEELYMQQPEGFIEPSEKHLWDLPKLSTFQH